MGNRQTGKAWADRQSMGNRLRMKVDMAPAGVGEDVKRRQSRGGRRVERES